SDSNACIGARRGYILGASDPDCIYRGQARKNPRPTPDHQFGAWFSVVGCDHQFGAWLGVYAISFFGNNDAPFATRQPVTSNVVTPPSPNLPGVVRKSAGAPSCDRSSAHRPGMKGDNAIACRVNCRTSAASVASSSSCLVGSFASFHGAWRSTYSLPRATVAHMYSSARLGRLSCIAASYAAMSAASTASSSFGSSGGTSAPLYFSIIAIVRLARLPHAFARSAL